MADEDLSLDSAEQRSVLYKVLALNLGLSAALGIAGWLADSSALIANALDNLSDSVVYAISLYAVGRAAGSKVRAAQFSGGLLLVFAEEQQLRPDRIAELRRKLPGASVDF